MTSGSSAPDLTPLPARLAQLEALVTEQQTTLTTLHQALEQAREQITLLKKALFAPKRERYVPSPDQKLLFETTPTEPPPAAPAAENSSPPRPRRKPRGKFVFPDFLPIVREEHTLPPAECACGQCGAERVIIRTQTTKQLELERANAYIVEQVRHTYACPHCRTGEQLQTTAKTPAPLEKSPFGASALAWLISAKFERHLPSYRQQERLLEPLGMWLSRSLIAGLFLGAARVLRPLVACGLQELLQSRVIQADETPVNYLGGEPGKSAQGYLFGYAGDVDHRFLYYDFRPSRCRAGPAEILADYQGVLLTDGFSGYEALIRESCGRLVAAACWMHARRGFDQARATTAHPLVEETLARIRQLYDLEDRVKSLPREERQALREREARPLVEQLFTRLEQDRGNLRPTTPLAQAVEYACKRRVELLRFLDNERIELDTGLLERSLRGPALGRNYVNCRIMCIDPEMSAVFGGERARGVRIIIALPKTSLPAFWRRVVAAASGGMVGMPASSSSLPSRLAGIGGSSGYFRGRARWRLRTSQLRTEADAWP